MGGLSLFFLNLSYSVSRVLLEAAVNAPQAVLEAAVADLSATESAPPSSLGNLFRPRAMLGRSPPKNCTNDLDDQT